MFDIGIDLDGVLHDFGESFRKYVLDNGIRTADQCGAVEEMDFYLKWGISHEEFLEICHAGVDAGVVFSHGRPFKGAVPCMRRLKKLGNRLHIITDRSFGTDNYSEEITRQWLQTYKVPYDTLTFSADKTCVPTDFMIDDKPENIQALWKAGTKAYLLNRPWNLEFNAGKYRTDSFEDFVKVVNQHDN